MVISLGFGTVQFPKDLKRISKTYLLWIRGPPYILKFSWPMRCYMIWPLGPSNCFLSGHPLPSTTFPQQHLPCPNCTALFFLIGLNRSPSDVCHIHIHLLAPCRSRLQWNLAESEDSVCSPVKSPALVHVSWPRILAERRI